MPQANQNATPDPQSRKPWQIHPIPLLLGVILLVAGAVKGYELLLHPVSSGNQGEPRWVFLALAGCEIGLGLWLISCLHGRFARRIGFIAFTVFATVSVLKMWGGAESCGCLGSVRIPPMYALAFDIGALAVLLYW